eukprot:CAMPEP_0196746886 /NCGR_PEP_ID=MMETSP1091-20130531/67431_1 /TAXON_ID=302021 /ORGANISM="Rhodomonas sp., Strain CCMP768" /LENGTH=44 /DNA_ID= /DNA_START= /DNA_END= /DNA_ORIENTATION=
MAGLRGVVHESKLARFVVSELRDPTIAVEEHNIRSVGLLYDGCH